MTEALLVLLSGDAVGLLEYFPTRDEYVFSFEPDYLQNPERKVLGQLFEDYRPNSFSSKGMPSWFANLLPQDRLRTIVASGLSIDPKKDFQLLSAIGQDLPGAVETLPSERRLATPDAMIWQAPTPAERPEALRFSLAGVQLKLSVLRGERGLTVPVQGKDGLWIAKFDDPRYPSLPRVERATMLWAEKSGIDVPECLLSHVSEFTDDLAGMEIGNGSVFLIRRFDRVGEEIIKRVHMEDFAQILDRMPGEPQYDGTYEQIAAVLARIAPSSLEEFIKRLVFCVLTGNGDAHLKNWSVIYPDGRNAHISPAYDLVSTILYSPNDNLALSLSGSRKFDKVTADSFRALAAAAGLDWTTVSTWITSTAERVVGVWKESGDELEYTSRERSLLDRHIARNRLRKPNTR